MFVTEYVYNHRRSRLQNPPKNSGIVKKNHYKIRRVDDVITDKLN